MEFGSEFWCKICFTLNNFRYSFKKAIYNDFVFCVSRNFLRISRKFRTNFNIVFCEIFAKLKENFAKREIENLAKILQKHENENFRSHPKRVVSKKLQQLSACLSVHLSACLFICLLVCSSACLSVHSSACLFICLPVCSSVCLSVHLSVSLFICLNLSACLFISLPVCPSVCLSVHLSACLLICLPVCSSACLYGYLLI